MSKEKRKFHNKNKTSYKTIKMMDIDLDMEQGVRIKSGDVQFLIYKVYGKSGKLDALKRQHLKRINKGQCTYAGCPNDAYKGFKKCKIHMEFDRIRSKLRRENKHANHKKKVQKNKK
jgi:hypothetical protein